MVLFETSFHAIHAWINVLQALGEVNVVGSTKLVLQTAHTYLLWRIWIDDKFFRVHCSPWHLWARLFFLMLGVHGFVHLCLFQAWPKPIFAFVKLGHSWHHAHFINLVLSHDPSGVFPGESVHCSAKKGILWWTNPTSIN